MSLSPSCENLYFPAEPQDNIISLKWNTSDTPLEPNTSVIFKVKCTAPQLFHVVPRYGALLLADATGTSVQNSQRATEITFSLRDNHAEGEDGGDGAAPSTLNRASTARASRAASATPGGPAYQERFAIEYVMIKSEALAFQQILNTLSDHAKQTEVVKSMWSLVASGAIPRAHLGVQASINMKVFLENVVVRRSDPAQKGRDEATKIIVPAEARLVPPGSRDRATHASARHASATNSHHTNGEASAANSTPNAPRRKAVDELRALKEEINIMRRDPAASLGQSPHGGSPQNLTSPNTATASSPAALRDARGPLKTVVPPSGAGEDVLMKFDAGCDAATAAAGGAGKKKGLKVYVVLIIMFVLYIFLLLMRRGPKHAVQANAVAESGNAAANPLAMQVSSRELETRA